jgi:predicted RNA-binding protein associated with RNAse of E/G family
MDRRFSSGEAVTLRETWSGRVFYARPATVVEDTAVRSVFYVPPVVRSLEPEDEDGTTLRIPDRDWRLEDREVRHNPFLSFAFPDTSYAILASWDAKTYEFRGWYINLQSPLRRTDVGFDTREHVLDVLIPPDRSSWAWKDEDELAQAVEEGLFTEDEAARFRAAGERAVEQVLLREPPFDRDWEAWRPDPAWETPELSEATTAVPVAV